MNLVNLTEVPATDPTSVYRYRDGLYAADLLTAAIVWLDFFSWLAEHPSDHSSIRDHFEFADRPVDVMITLFVAMGLLRRKGEILEVTALAREHLVKSSPWFLGPYYASLKDRPVCKDMVTVLKTGKPANWGSLKNELEWSKAMENPQFAAQFTAAMDCRGVYLGQAAAKALNGTGHRKLLDIGGGSGIYSCSIVAHHPHLTATVFEKPPVDKVAFEAIRQRGCEGKVNVRAGDIFSEGLPTGYDLHLISNVLHDWEPPAVRHILDKSFAALEPGGLLIIHDAHVNAEKSGPLPVAAYSAMLMHSTEGKCYSTAEIEEFFNQIGFVAMNFHETAADRSIITANKPI